MNHLKAEIKVICHHNFEETMNHYFNHGLFPIDGTVVTRKQFIIIISIFITYWNNQNKGA